LGIVEILWWLAPSAVVTVLAMLWVGWLGRDGRGEVDRDEAAERLGRALRTEHKGLQQRSPRVVRPADRSRGVAVRPSRAGRDGEQRRTA